MACGYLSHEEEQALQGISLIQQMACLNAFIEKSNDEVVKMIASKCQIEHVCMYCKEKHSSFFSFCEHLNKCVITTARKPTTSRKRGKKIQQGAIVASGKAEIVSGGSSSHQSCFPPGTRQKKLLQGKQSIARTRKNKKDLLINQQENFKENHHDEIYHERSHPIENVAAVQRPSYTGEDVETLLHDESIRSGPPRRKFATRRVLQGLQDLSALLPSCMIQDETPDRSHLVTQNEGLNRVYSGKGYQQNQSHLVTSGASKKLRRSSRTRRQIHDDKMASSTGRYNLRIAEAYNHN